ncbi:uncharacterized protein LOC126991289 isoform X2 [Eriocheir sinensis]|uniref:uncharacterized protein LOC126990690 n=1 Tax=Eriocheir sinensis TaxID=95602 RepID=UPI0021C57F80|nr:uncharacterized protein LOC126990690 [Eriocheir sinensis]XP_050706027.1 uncharacterized protein LOC126991289 isoform X2 [Eriocheir sinensis]
MYGGALPPPPPPEYSWRAAMSKQKRRNAFFFYFMMAMKPEVEERLKRKVEMAKLVTAEWQALPEEQWKKYQLMTGESRERLDCRGVTLRCLDEAAQEKKHQAEEMKRDIVDLVDIIGTIKKHDPPPPG